MQHKLTHRRLVQALHGGAESVTSRVSFDAFISYSHAADGALAPALRRALQGLARPWYRRRALAVFLDKTSLAAEQDLPAALQRALMASRHFIYLASPEAADSPWVGKELITWRAAHGGNGLLIALTAGDLQWRDDLGDFDPDVSNALHPELRGVFTREPLWVDLRWARTQHHVSLRDPRFLQAAAMLAARLHGLNLDDLLGEDVLSHRRRRRVIAGTVTGLLVMLLAVAATAWLAGRTALDLQQRQQMLDSVLPFFASRYGDRESGVPWRAFQAAVLRAMPWRRPAETDVIWHEQPRWIVVQEDCISSSSFPDEPRPDGCAPAGTPYGPEGLRADLPWLPALARQLAADFTHGRVARLLGAPLPNATNASTPAESESAEEGDDTLEQQASANLARLDDLADILIPPMLRGAGSSPDDIAAEARHTRVSPWEASRTLSLVRYPLQAEGMVAELLLINLSDHRWCGSGQCISPTLAYLRRNDDLHLIWIDMAASQLTLLDRGPGQIPDILAIEATQGGSTLQRRRIARHEFVTSVEGMRYQVHMDGEVRATMPRYSAPIPPLKQASVR